MRTLLVLASLATLVSAEESAPATPNPFFPQGATDYGPNTIGLEDAFWPEGAYGGHAFEDVLLADLDDDGSLDGFVRNAGRLIFMTQLDVHTSIVPVTVAGEELVGVTAMALHRAQGVVAGLVICDASGLRYLRQLAANVFEDHPGFVAPVGWSDALQLVSVDTQHSGDDDLFALSQDGTQVLRHGFENGQWSSAPPLTLTDVAVRIVPLQWDADPLFEVATVSSVGLKIVDDDGQGGAVVHDRNSPLAPGLIGRVRMGDPESVDRVAWLVHSGTAAMLAVIRPGGQDVFHLGSELPVALTDGDPDGDGDDDLVVTWASSYDVTVLEHHGATLYDPGSADVIDTSPGATKVGVIGNTVGVAWGDVTADGHLDVVIPSVARGSLVIATAGPYLGSNAYSVGPRALLEGSSEVCLNAFGQVTLGVDAQYFGFDASEADGWRLTTWTQERGDLPPLAASSSTCSIPASDLQTGTDSFRLRLTFDPDELWPGGGDTQDWEGDERLFHLLMQPVNRKGNDDPLDDVPLGSPLLGTLSFDTQGLSYVPLSDDWFSGDDYATLLDCGTNQFPSGDNPIGGFYSVKRFPSLPGEIPVLTDFCLQDLSDV